jgi:hypothetical protein
LAYPDPLQKIPGYFWVGYPGTLAGSLGGKGEERRERERERERDKKEHSRTKQEQARNVTIRYRLAWG